MLKKGLLYLVPILLVTDVVAMVPLGSVAIYSDGRAEKLLEVSPKSSTWEDDRKRRFVRSINPALPPLERAEFLGKRGYRQAVRSGDPGRLASLPVDNPVEFVVVRTQPNGNTSKRHWECAYKGQRKAKVLGKSRVLDDYSCQRFVIHKKLWTRHFREQRDFSYSEELGLVVKQKRQTRKSTSTRKLVKVLMPGSANYKNIRKALKKIRERKAAK